MNDYKRITMREFARVTGDKIYKRLSALEDKIESGELVDRNSYLDRLMAAKDISGMSDKELEFFAKHNARVRENADAEIARLTAKIAKHDVKVCKEVVKECLQVLHNTGMTYLYDTHSWDGIEVIDIAIKRLAEKYNIDLNEEVEE